MDNERELEYLREKVALLERCLEYERLLRDMREAAPREPVVVPYPYPVPPWTAPYDPTRLVWEPDRTTTGSPPHRVTLWNDPTHTVPCAGHVGVNTC